MAIIFADIVPEINKLYEYTKQIKKDELRYGRTYYKFVPVDEMNGRPELMLFVEKLSTRRHEGSSRLYTEYQDIVSRNRNSETLTRHEKSIVRAIYKYIYSRFDTTVDALSTNTQPLTTLQGKVTKLENQLNMLKAIKNVEKLAPRYVKLCGLIIPLEDTPEDPYESVTSKIKNARSDLDYRLRQVASANTKRKKEQLASNIEDTVKSLENSLPDTEAEIKTLINGIVEWKVRYQDTSSLHFGAFASCDIDDLDKFLNTQDGRFHNMLMRNGNKLNTSYWTQSFINSSLNTVLFFNGIDTYQKHKAYTAEDYAKIGKISQIFGIIQAVEQEVAVETCNKNHDGYHYDLRDHFDRVRNKLKEIGYDPDISLL